MHSESYKPRKAKTTYNLEWREYKLTCELSSIVLMGLCPHHPDPCVLFGSIIGVHVFFLIQILGVLVFNLKKITCDAFYLLQVTHPLKGGPGASGRVLPPVTGSSRVRVALHRRG